MVGEQLTEVKASVQEWRKQRLTGQKLWSLAHHVALYGATIIGVVVAFVVQLDNAVILSLSNEDLATVLAIIAAVLAGSAGVGRFETKWRANRISRSSADALLIDCSKADPDVNQILERLKELTLKHDRAIVGLESED